MVFRAKTAAPVDMMTLTDRQKEIKELLFRAVGLYVNGNEDAKQELMAYLEAPEAADMPAGIPQPEEPVLFGADDGFGGVEDSIYGEEPEGLDG